MPITSYSAANEALNTTIEEGHRLLGLVAEAGLGTGVLYANPVAGDAAPAGGLVAESDFATAGVPTDGTPLYLQLQIPGNQDFADTYTVSMVLARVDSGTSIREALS